VYRSQHHSDESTVDSESYLAVNGIYQEAVFFPNSNTALVMSSPHEGPIFIFNHHNEKTLKPIKFNKLQKNKVRLTLSGGNKLIIHSDHQQTGDVVI
tara:strand:+ start:217 stop:507 length:291 start_codon:yes stop_codon:yes gene_type:complete